MGLRSAAWRPLTVSVAFLALHALPVAAVDQNACSSVNTGSNSTPYNDIFMSAGLCRDTCKSQGQPLAIVQGKNCWCSSVAPGSTTSTSNCADHCPGYPFENCGSSSNFGYIDTGAGSISGTQGSQSQSQPVQTSSSGSSSPQPVPVVPIIQTQTQMQTQTQLQTQTKVSVSTKVETIAPPPPSSTTFPSTSSALFASTSSFASTSTTTTPPPAMVVSPVTVHDSTFVPTPVTSIQIVTTGGAVVTNYVTLTPTAPVAQNTLPQPKDNGLSNGAVAGITIGAILAAAIVGGLVFWFCFAGQRRRGGGGGLNRNTSVLSKVGLLRTNSVGPFTSGPPRVNTTGLEAHENGPRSAGTLESGSQMSEGRRSRPLFVDNRLNPNAMFSQSNASRTSIGTLQDNQDYSRPLEVRNPD